MIRRYTRDEYLARARRLAAARPGLTLSTDIIVGFPGETDDDFEQTLSLVREVGFVTLFGFKYSERPHTPARKLADDVCEEAKSVRLARLFETIDAQTRAHLTTLVGTRQRVLAEGASKMGEGRVQGRTERNEIVHIDAPRDRSVIGAIVECDVVRANKHSLEARLTDDALASLPRAERAHAPRPRALPVLA